MLEKIEKWGVQDHQLSNAAIWICFGAIFFFGFTSTFNMFKTSSVLIHIAGDLGIAPANRGWVMLSYSLVSAIVAYPGLWIMRKFGVKSTLTFSCVLMIIGSIIGYFSYDTTSFLTSRFFEGCGFGLICVMGPNVTARLFPKQKLGTAMGLWSLWMPVGTMLAFFLSPAVYTAAGDWHPTWLIAIALGVLSLIFILFGVKMPKVAANEGRSRYAGKPAGKNFMGSAILLGVLFVVWAYVYIVNINTFYPAFLQEQKGLSVFDSSMLPEIIGGIHIITGLIISALASKIKSYKLLVWGPFIIVGILMMFFAFTPDQSMVGPYIFAVVMGIMCSCLPMAMRTLIPLMVTDQRRCELGLATMAFFTGVGKCLSNFASWCIATIGSTANAEFILGPACIIAGILVLVFVKSDKTVRETRAAEAKEFEAADTAEAAAE